MLKFYIPRLAGEHVQGKGYIDWERLLISGTAQQCLPATAQGEQSFCEELNDKFSMPALGVLINERDSHGMSRLVGCTFVFLLGAMSFGVGVVAWWR